MNLARIKSFIIDQEDLLCRNIPRCYFVGYCFCYYETTTVILRCVVLKSADYRYLETLKFWIMRLVSKMQVTLSFKLQDIISLYISGILHTPLLYEESL